ncbi:DUF5372 family protein [Actinophytocola sp.]|uniref:DUF5372 family protein n=1 Tax=Actinophytocola sp. TaxID=1872138 RepID=UPI0039C882EE
MTHRFHPLFGREFEFVVHRHNWAEDRVYCRRFGSAIRPSPRPSLRRAESSNDHRLDRGDDWSEPSGHTSHSGTATRHSLARPPQRGAAGGQQPFGGRESRRARPLGALPTAGLLRNCRHGGAVVPPVAPPPPQ